MLSPSAEGLEIYSELSKASFSYEVSESFLFYLSLGKHQPFVKQIRPLEQSWSDLQIFGWYKSFPPSFSMRIYGDVWIWCSIILLSTLPPSFTIFEVFWRSTLSEHQPLFKQIRMPEHSPSILQRFGPSLFLDSSTIIIDSDRKTWQTVWLQKNRNDILNILNSYVKSQLERMNNTPSYALSKQTRHHVSITFYVLFVAYCRFENLSSPIRPTYVWLLSGSNSARIARYMCGNVSETCNNKYIYIYNINI